jgi:CxxC motif-containing protein (DUF1111 family)
MLSPRARVPALAALAATLVAAALAGVRGWAQEGAASAADALSRPATALTAAQRERFELGRRLFLQHWSVAPSAFGQWGRGPLSNGEACTDCHADGGRGRPPASADEALRSGLVRLGVRSGERVLPHPAYGDQLQTQGVLGKVPAEGDVQVQWVEHAVALADGSVVRLREPRLRFVSLAYGALGAGAVTSLRVAPPLSGVGSLDAVPRSALEAIERRQAGSSVAGRLHRTGSDAGRFGHKAAQASLRLQLATALHADLGVTTSLFPHESCTQEQPECLAFPASGQPEMRDAELDLLEDYVRALAEPARRDATDLEIQRGEYVFTRIGCVACHLPALPLGDGRTAHPYTDLLLHDLGAGLADARPEGNAGGAEWRTAPLWGLGLHPQATLLHDGRARSIEEAVLWHGGQAQPSRERFRALLPAERRALLAFLGSL